MNTTKKEAYIQELIEKTKAGDNDAFGDLYSLFLDDVYRFVYFKVESEEVGDITENVFIKAWEKINSYTPTGGTFRTWLFSIARNTVIDYYRTRKNPTPISEALEIIDERQSPVLDTELRLNKDLVRRAIARLPENYREIITLKFINELTNEEIEQITRKQQATIRILQFRGLQQLRDILGKMKEHLA